MAQAAVSADSIAGSRILPESNRIKYLLGVRIVIKDLQDAMEKQASSCNLNFFQLFANIYTWRIRICIMPDNALCRS